MALSHAITGLLGLALVFAGAAPAAAAPPQPFSLECPLDLPGTELDTLPLDQWDAPPGWSQDPNPYGYLFARLPVIGSSAYKGILSCNYGIPQPHPSDYGFLNPPSGYRLARIQQNAPWGYWCTPRNEPDFVGFDCTPWVWWP